MTRRTWSVYRDIRNMPPLTMSPLMELVPRQSKYKSPVDKVPRPPSSSGNVYLDILSSPERFCLLTQRVLPRDLLIKFQLVKSPESPTTKSLMYFVPTGLLHPRFVAPTVGKGAYVVCWKEAVQLVAIRGSYKRLSSSATMLPHTPVQISSQLSRRVVQEIEMYSERVKAAPGVVKTLAGQTRLRACPIKRLTVEEVDSVQGGSLSKLQRDGDELLGIISLDESFTLTPNDQFSILLPQDTALESSRIPAYDLTTLLRSIVIPGNDVKTTFPTQGLIDRARSHFDQVIDLFSRRALRSLEAASLPRFPLDATSATPKERPILPKSNVHYDIPRIGVYAIYNAISPSPPLGNIESDQDPAHFPIPLLLSLWRCRLWIGEGWEGTERGEPASWSE